jgi:hypothetical protein
MKITLLAFLFAAVSFTPAHALSHERYAALLASAVVEGKVAYEGLAQKPALLEAVRSEFARVDENAFSASSSNEQLAYLINSYNFFTIELVVKNLPLKNGIRDIEGGWDKKFIHLFGQLVSLNYLEHQLVRKNYSEPRIHFALVCAAQSCPQLLDKPYVAAELESQLEAAAKRFLGDRSKNRIEGTTLLLSEIFNWYGSDFDGLYAGGFRDYVAIHFGIPPGKYAVKYLPYDWRLNRAPTR